MRRRSKYNAWGNLPPKTKRPECEYCGFKHDSKAEAAFCEHLHLLMRAGEDGIRWIDVFPTVTLDQDGERWKLDFCMWRWEAYGRSPVFYDVKGFETPEFKRKRKKFDRRHPAAPLLVVKRKRKGWIYE